MAKSHEGVTMLIPRRRYSSAYLINNRLVVLGIFPDQYKADKVFRMASAMEDRYESDNQFREITGANRLCLYRMTETMAYTLVNGEYRVRVPFDGVFHDMGFWPTRIEAGLAYDVAKHWKGELNKLGMESYRGFVKDKTEELICRAGYRG